MIKVFLKTAASIVIFIFLLVAAALVSSVVINKFTYKFILADIPLGVKYDDETRTVIIDPGHGGEDPGAVGVGGVLEKDINLALSKKIKKLLEFERINVIMTREDDVLLYSEDMQGSKKAQDLRNRLDYQDRYPDAIFVSIHMNKFSLEYCRGLQVYYSENNSDSSLIAESIRRNIVDTLQPDNKRECKAADTSIFILKNIKIPAVLIECGFISNYEEAALLTSDKYQNALSALIAAAIIYNVSDSGK